MANGDTAIKVYKYNRGELYSVQIGITPDEDVIFTKVIHPENSSEQVVIRLLDDAERESLKLFRAEKEKLWSSS